jgi:hypothetical protein
VVAVTPVKWWPILGSDDLCGGAGVLKLREPYKLCRDNGDPEPYRYGIALRGQTLTEFAKSIGMDPRTLRRCMRGDPVRNITRYRIGAVLRWR